MKKVLIICTSPRKGGNSEVLANFFLKGAQEAGVVKGIGIDTMGAAKKAAAHLSAAYEMGKAI